MKQQIKYEWVEGRDCTDRLKKFLYEVDDIMIPRLSARVSIEDYAKKLSENASNLFAEYGESDIGECSVYCNTDMAYVTSISIKEQFSNRKIGLHMMSIVKAYILEKGCTKIQLRVHKTNIVAISFYKKCGFNKKIDEDEWIIMEWGDTGGKEDTSDKDVNASI